MNKLRRAVRWARDVEWAVVATVLSGVVMLIPDIILIIDEGLAEVDGQTPLIVVATLITARLIRSNVWSRATVSQLTNPDVIQDPPV